MNLRKIREELRNEINHRGKWHKHVSILEEVGTGYSVLKWSYDNHKVEARSKDYLLLSSIRKTIEMYLEEKEQNYKPHELIRYNVTYEEDEVRE